MLEYLNPRFDDFFTFDNEIRSVTWKELFLAKIKDIESQTRKNNLELFKKVFVDSWKKQKIQNLIKKLDLCFEVVINQDYRFKINQVRKIKNQKFGGDQKLI